ncbi:MAG: aldehyde dehydrogenase family protein, partial [Sciscionella sp.]
ADLPGGVANVLTGRAAELGPWLAAHGDVNALDLGGAAAGEHGELQRLAADTVKRVLPLHEAEDWTARPNIRRLRGYLEPKTVWHPMGP